MLGGIVRDSRRGTMWLAGARLGAGMEEGCSLETWDSNCEVGSGAELQPSYMSP